MQSRRGSYSNHNLVQRWRTCDHSRFRQKRKLIKTPSNYIYLCSSWILRLLEVVQNISGDIQISTNILAQIIVNNYFEKDVVKIFRPMMLQNFLFPFLKNIVENNVFTLTMMICVFFTWNWRSSKCQIYNVQKNSKFKKESFFETTSKFKREAVKWLSRSPTSLCMFFSDPTFGLELCSSLKKLCSYLVQ